MPVNPTDFEVLDAVRDRWSPYRFEPREVSDEQLLRCLEAARWAASSFNDQPWFFIVALRQDSAQFEQMIGCLAEPNQGWARNAGALILTVTRSSFAYNGKPNRVALHDLGQAAAYLALQATALGLQVHQMAGINLSKVRQKYGVPDGHDPQTAIAIGYPDRTDPTDESSKQLRQRETGSRQRRRIAEQVFADGWGNPAAFVRQ